MESGKKFGRTANAMAAVMAIGITVFMLMVSALAASTVPAAAADYGHLAEVNATNFLPSAIHAGDTVSLAVDIKNRGSGIDMQDVNATLSTGPQFSLIESEALFTGIRPGETKTAIFTFKVNSDTAPNYYQSFLTIGYMRDGKPVMENDTITIPVSRAERNLDITLEPGIINPGTPTDVTFSLKNLGGVPISNVSFSWSEKNGLVLPIESDNRRFVQSVARGTGYAPYKIAADPNIAPGIYQLDITASFNDSNGTRTQTSQVGLIVGGGTDFEVSAEPQSSGEMSLNIANIGTNNAQSVVVKVTNPEAFGIINATQILGNLNKGDFTIANFETATSRQATAAGTTQTTGATAATGGAGQRGGGAGFIFGGRQQGGSTAGGTTEGNAVPGAQGQQQTQAGGELHISINYTDTTGQRQTIEKSIPIGGNAMQFPGRFSGTGTRNDNTLGIALFVIIAAIAAGLNHFRFKKNWKLLGGAIVACAAVFLILGVVLPGIIGTALSAIASAAIFAWLFLKYKKK